MKKAIKRKIKNSETTIEYLVQLGFLNEIM